MMVAVSDEMVDSVLLSWDVPLSTDPITGYDYALDGGSWTATTATANMFRLGSLESGRTYSVRVRARNTNGAGPGSVAVMFTTVSPSAPSVPRFVRGDALGGRFVDLVWRTPSRDNGADISRYEICVVEEDGTIAPFEPTDDASLTWRVRGLALWHRYGFRVRAVNSAGAGAQSPIVYVTVVPAMPRITAPAGQRVPLLDEDRQTLIVTLGDQDCRVTVWWQPRDRAWYGSLEVPTNTPIVSGRRLALNAGLLDRVGGILSGNLVMRELGDTGDEPARDAFARPTHALMYEAD